MSQADVYKILQKSGKYMNSKEIAKKAKTKNIGLINRSLAKLFKHGEVFRVEKSPGRGYLWGKR